MGTTGDGEVTVTKDVSIPIQREKTASSKSVVQEMPSSKSGTIEMEISSTTTKTEISREIEMEETAQASSSSAMKSISTASTGTSYPLQGSGSAVKIEEIQGPVYPVERKHEYPKD